MLHGTTQKAHNILGVHLEPGSVPEPSRATRIQDTGVAWAVEVLDARINAIQMAMSFYAGGLPAERQPARRSCTYLLTHPAVQVLCRAVPAGILKILGKCVSKLSHSPRTVNVSWSLSQIDFTKICMGLRHSERSAEAMPGRAKGCGQ